MASFVVPNGMLFIFFENGHSLVFLQVSCEHLLMVMAVFLTATWLSAMDFRNCNNAASTFVSNNKRPHEISETRTGYEIESTSGKTLSPLWLTLMFCGVCDGGASFTANPACGILASFVQSCEHRQSGDGRCYVWTGTESFNHLTNDSAKGLQREWLLYPLTAEKIGSVLNDQRSSMMFKSLASSGRCANMWQKQIKPRLIPETFQFMK